MKYLEEQIKLHPSMTSCDMIKMLYQGAFGAEHILADIALAKRYFDEEFERTPATNQHLFEQISDSVCRINFGAWKREGLKKEWLFNIFVNSGYNSECNFEELLYSVEKYIGRESIEEYLSGGIRPLHHSEVYRQKEKPAYRIAEIGFIYLLPVLQSLQGSGVIAIDGRAASGKSSLSSRLAKVLDAPLIHMDDFFLPPALRTKERLTEAGGNIHYERFLSQVVEKLGGDFYYSIFDCGKMELSGTREIKKSDYTIVEGAYSCHPKFGNYADLKVFFTVDEKEQLKRILHRNGERMAERFASEWIPMEEKYFFEFKIRENADIIIKPF